MNFVIIILLLTLSGCYGSDSPGAVETKDEITLDLWMDLPIKNGHYVFDYPTNKPSSYTEYIIKLYLWIEYSGLLLIVSQ